MEVTMYVWSQGSHRRAATREMLKGIRLPAVTTDEEGNETTEDVSLDTDERIEAAFPGGAWHTATFREDVTGEDVERASAKQWVNGQHRPWLYGKSWVLTLLLSWDFPEIRNMEGYGKLPEDVTAILEAAVIQMRERFDLPNSIALSTPRRES